MQNKFEVGEWLRVVRAYPRLVRERGRWWWLWRAYDRGTLAADVRFVLMVMELHGLRIGRHKGRSV